MRYCSRCNRPRTPEHHDQVPVVLGHLRGKPLYAPDFPPPIVGWYEGHPVFADEDSRPRMRYTCRVTLITTSPVTGKHYEASNPTRIAELDTRWVHNDRLEFE